MMRANVLSAVLAIVLTSMLSWHCKFNWRHQAPPDSTTRRRRYVIGWEVRGWVLAVVVPCGVAMLFGYVSRDYLLSLILFQAAGFLAADMIAPSGLSPRR
jgi:hypothetical protein